MIKPQEFKKRRTQLMKIAGENSIIILNGRAEYLRNGDVHYGYRQDSDLYYLSGFNEPDAVLVLCPGSEFGDHLMFCREADPLKIIWDGPMLGTKGVEDDLGFDAAFDIKQIDQMMPQLMQGREKIMFKLGEDAAFDQKISQWMKSIESRKWHKSPVPEELMSISHAIHDMRLYKSNEEIKCMKKSADLASRAHIRMMQACQPGKHEYDLQAEFMHELVKNQSHPSYPPIIGSGDNACILHYINNNQAIKDGDMVLIDAGAEYDFYASDITRTFPANGKFSARQKDLYQVVLQSQYDAIEQVQVGKHWHAPHDAAVKTLSQGLLDLKILKGSLDQVLEERLYAQYYMHMTGHWLGLDVHDCGDYRVDDLWIELEENMVLTVEPGVYIGQNTKAPDAWKGIGIRIEDDIQVTKKGPKILSENAPKTIEEIEAIMNQL
ncbi:aminopeptidase P N-terminal domain-containing protein [Marinicella rhabdoformis]|uniref:aminopeptidase P N-terminal domain-containing protein n=1 Tax=Marinicella rhabdoformis TaxID=2580566 RepID=UPI0012AEDED8|nr:aminopeptidase P N-terminal domain-containing protein [Marinicella rhabdoformis]